LSTWAETPEPTRSDCHAWSAHPNYDLLTLVAGIKPAAPGFTSVRVEPHPGSVANLSGSFPHLKGPISFAYSRSSSGVTAEINLPAGLAGTLLWRGREYLLHAGAQSLVLPLR
jgi:hypothetical protein